jgi:hypothetical protein
MKALFVLAVALMPAYALAANPSYVLCAKGTTITAKKACGTGERRLNKTSLTGATGAAGPKGTINLSSCTKREVSSTGFSSVTATAACLVSEFILDSNCFAHSGPGIVANSELYLANNSELPTEAYQLLWCNGLDVFSTGDQIGITAQLMCCRS